MEKSVEMRVKECREIVIQGLEKTVQHKMVYMFLKDHKIESEVKQFSVNCKAGTAKLEFNSHESAKNFYENYNFVEKILIRPFNIYFNLTLEETEVKKYLLERVSEEKLRRLFEACRKIGICKINTHYVGGPRGKIKSNAVVSFIRTQKISESEHAAFSQSLKPLDISYCDFIPEKGLRCSIIMTNFYVIDDYNREDEEIKTEARQKLADLLEKIDTVYKFANVFVKRRESADGTQKKVHICGILECNPEKVQSVDTVMQQFEKIRDHLVNDEVKATLYFHNEENNSYLSLFTPNLKKPTELTVKQFENKLLHDFRIINPNVIQVIANHVQYNDTYIGRVYLRSEAAGKDFLVDYINKKSAIIKNYSENSVTFNINIDSATLRKIRQAEKRAKQTEEKIKKSSEACRRENRKPANVFPIQASIPIGLGPQIALPNLQSARPQIISPILPFNLAPPGIPISIASSLRVGVKLESMSPNILGQHLQSSEGMEQRIKSILKDKSNFMRCEMEQTKRLLAQPLKYLIEKSGVPSSQSGQIMNEILFEDEMAEVFKYFDSPSELQARINKITK